MPSGTLPANDTYRITDADLQLYAAAVPAWNGTIVLDVNLRNPTDPTLAVNHVKAAAAQVGWGLIEGIEIGNEVSAPSQAALAGADLYTACLSAQVTWSVVLTHCNTSHWWCHKQHLLFAANTCRWTCSATMA